MWLSIMYRFDSNPQNEVMEIPYIYTWIYVYVDIYKRGRSFHSNGMRTPSLTKNGLKWLEKVKVHKIPYIFGWS